MIAMSERPTHPVPAQGSADRSLVLASAPVSGLSLNRVSAEEASQLTPRSQQIGDQCRRNLDARAAQLKSMLERPSPPTEHGNSDTERVLRHRLVAAQTELQQQREERESIASGAYATLYQMGQEVTSSLEQWEERLSAQIAEMSALKQQLHATREELLGSRQAQLLLQEKLGAAQMQLAEAAGTGRSVQAAETAQAALQVELEKGEKLRATLSSCRELGLSRTASTEEAAEALVELVSMPCAAHCVQAEALGLSYSGVCEQLAGTIALLDSSMQAEHELRQQLETSEQCRTEVLSCCMHAALIRVRRGWLWCR